VRGGRNQTFHRRWSDPGDSIEHVPLPFPRERLQVIVEQLGVAQSARLALQRQCDQVAESTLGHVVLAGKQPVVRVERQFVACGHRLGQHVAAELACGPRRDGGREEEPNVRTVSRPRAFDRERQIEPTARRDEGAHVVGPRGLVEVDGEEPTGSVGQHWVDAHHVFTAEVRQVRLIVGGQERLVRALAALHPWQFALALDELVGTRRPVALLALAAYEARRIDVGSAPKQAAEDRHLLGGRTSTLLDRRCRGH
jgi:hypothetical protein